MPTEKPSNQSRPGSSTPQPKVKPEPGTTPAPTQRLGSLSARSTPGGTTTGSAASTPKRAFLPKQVGRRSKEERDKSAPTASKVTVPVVAPAPSKRDGKGRTAAAADKGRSGGGAGKERRRGRFEPIATQATGAFSAIDAFDGRRKAGLAFEIKGSASLGEDISRALNGVKSGSDELNHDPNAFNMTRSLGIDIDEYFPIRPGRDELSIDGRETASDPEIEFSEDDSHSLTMGDVGSVIKSEPGTTPAAPAPQKSRSKSATPFALPPSKAHTYVSPEELVELKRVARDHKTIAREFNIQSILGGNRSPSAAATPIPQAGANEDAVPEIEQKLFFFQMPVLAPSFEPAPDFPAHEDDVDMTLTTSQPSSRSTAPKPPSGVEAEAEDPFFSQFPAGCAGKLRLHKSGKLTMLLGNIVMEVSQGTEAKFLQDIVAFEPEDQKAHLIGQVTRKMIVAPDIDALLAGVNGL